MSRFIAVTALATMLGGCVEWIIRPPEEELAPIEVDVDYMLEVVAEYDKYVENPTAFNGEFLTDAAGCIGPKWIDSHMFVYSPLDVSLGMGVHVEAQGIPIDQVDPSQPRSMLYNLEGERGDMMLWGFEWYFEPPGGQPLEEVPTLFGYPMPGVMEGHVPFQGFHYDVHAWPNHPHPDLDYEYFGEFHPEMPAPEWYLLFEQTLFATWRYNDFEPRTEDGYVEGTECIEGEGIHWVNEEYIGELDPFYPDTLLTDVSGLLLGVQWTIHESEVTEVPRMFEQEFWGPDEEGNYFLRAWMGTRTTGRYWAETTSTMSCNEFVIPESCMPDIPNID